MIWFCKCWILRCRLLIILGLLFKIIWYGFFFNVCIDIFLFLFLMLFLCLSWSCVLGLFLFVINLGWFVICFSVLGFVIDIRVNVVFWLGCDIFFFCCNIVEWFFWFRNIGLFSCKFILLFEFISICFCVLDDKFMCGDERDFVFWNGKICKVIFLVEFDEFRRKCLVFVFW